MVLPLVLLLSDAESGSAIIAPVYVEQDGVGGIVHGQFDAGVADRGHGGAGVRMLSGHVPRHRGRDSLLRDRQDRPRAGTAWRMCSGSSAQLANRSERTFTGPTVGDRIFGKADGGRRPKTIWEISDRNDSLSLSVKELR